MTMFCRCDRCMAQSSQMVGWVRVRISEVSSAAPGFESFAEPRVVELCADCAESLDALLAGAVECVCEITGDEGEAEPCESEDELRVDEADDADPLDAVCDELAAGMKQAPQKASADERRRRFNPGPRDRKDARREQDADGRPDGDPAVADTKVTRLPGATHAPLPNEHPIDMRGTGRRAKPSAAFRMRAIGQDGWFEGTAAECAGYFGVTPSQIYKWANGKATCRKYEVERV